jgi:hypothetical protein
MTEEIFLKEPEIKEKYIPKRPKQNSYHISSKSSIKLTEDKNKELYPIHIIFDENQGRVITKEYAKSLMEALYFCLQDHYPEVFNE